MADTGPEQVALCEVFRALSTELGKQAAVAEDLDEGLAPLAKHLPDGARLQQIDRLRQSLVAMSVLAANAAGIASGKTETPVKASELTDGVELEAIRALICRECADQSRPMHTDVSLFL